MSASRCAPRGRERVRDRDRRHLGEVAEQLAAAGVDRPRGGAPERRDADRAVAVDERHVQLLADRGLAARTPRRAASSRRARPRPSRARRSRGRAGRRRGRGARAGRPGRGRASRRGRGGRRAARPRRRARRPGRPPPRPARAASSPPGRGGRRRSRARRRSRRTAAGARSRRQRRRDVLELVALGAQLVVGVREPLLLVLELGRLDLELVVLAVELVAALLQGVGHRVERPREPGELVAAADLDAGRQVARREPVGGGRRRGAPARRRSGRGRRRTRGGARRRRRARSRRR